MDQSGSCPPFRSFGPSRLPLALSLGAVKREIVGRLAAGAMTLYNLSLAVARAIYVKGAPAIEAALVKDLGTRFERELTELARLAISREQAPNRFRELFDQAILNGPGFTLRGGTNEILRGIVAKGLRPA